MKLIDTGYIKVYAVEKGLQISVQIEERGYMTFLVEWRIIQKALNEYYFSGIE